MSVIFHRSHHSSRKLFIYLILLLLLKFYELSSGPNGPTKCLYFMADERSNPTLNNNNTYVFKEFRLFSTQLIIYLS